MCFFVGKSEMLAIYLFNCPCVNIKMQSHVVSIRQNSTS